MLILKSSWKYDLEARNLAPRTITGYLISVDRFAAWCTSQDLKLMDITRSHIRAWLTFELTRLSPKSVVHYYNGVRAFFRGDMDAPVVMLAQIHGAVAALEALADRAEAAEQS